MSEIPEKVYFKNHTILKKVTSNNIITVIEGKNDPEHAICFSAHYDHMGGMGNMYYPGANDNASGIAVLLSLARYFEENQPPITLVFCFFTGEEQGLKGSWHYVKHPVFPLKNIVLAINLDMVGSGIEGYGIVGGNEQPGDVSIFEDIREEFATSGNLKLRPNAPNSDHFPFTRTRACLHYSFMLQAENSLIIIPDDIPETLDWESMKNTVLMMKEYIIEKS